jgi:hypothetical protein
MAAEEYRYRFQWTSPIVLSPHDPDVLYVTGNHVFKSRDQGQSYEMISPDLTRHDPETLKASGGPITLDHTGVEVYATIFAFAESPVSRGVLWAGSDDGLIHVSADDGRTWEDVTPPEDLLGPRALISIIEPSGHDADTAYVAANRYKQDDFAPYLLKTTDRGRHWSRIVEGLPADEYMRVVREDPEVAGLLYAGGERGAYVSFDAGAHFEPLQLNLPVVPIHDLIVSHGDLVAASHGRAFWILDDLAPVRAMASDGAVDRVRLFRPQDPVRLMGGAGLFVPKGTTFERHRAAMEFPTGTSYYVKKQGQQGEPPEIMDAGANPPRGVVLHYILPRDEDGVVVLTVRDASGSVLREFRSDAKEDEEPKPSTKAGHHRFIWDLRAAPATKVEGAESNPWDVVAPVVPPGAYTVELQAGDARDAVTFNVIPDPRVPASDGDAREAFALAVQVRDAVSRAQEAVNRIRKLRADMQLWVGRADGHPSHDGLKGRFERANAALTAAEGELIQVKGTGPDDDLQFAPKLNAQLAYLIGVIESGDGPPTAQTRAAFEKLSGELGTALARLESALAEEVAEFTQSLEAAHLPLVRTP